MPAFAAAAFEAGTAFGRAAASAAFAAGSLGGTRLRRPVFPVAAPRDVSAAAESSGSGVRLVIGCLQPVDGHMGIDLRRCERSVTEQFLNASQVGSTFQ